VSSSTLEAELGSGHFALKNFVILAMDLREVLLPGGISVIFHEENQAMIRVRNGKEPFHETHSSLPWY
jgi:hypothetical protein